MKKFFQEFKKFITRGNIVDMAVGVIVGSAFTAIVNGLSNFVLKPLINMLLYFMMGQGALEKIYTILVPQYTVGEDGVEVLDLAKSIYIDWGSFISAIINFFIVAFVLFSIVKIINHIRENGKKLEAETLLGLPTKEDRAELKKRGIKLYDKDAVDAYLAEKAKKAEEAKAAAAEKARLEKEANPSTEDLLKQIIAILKEKE